MPALGLDGVARLQTPLLLALAYKGAQVFSHALSEPVEATKDASMDVTLCKAHCTSLLYQAATLKPLILFLSF